MTKKDYIALAAALARLNAKAQAEVRNNGAFALLYLGGVQDATDAIADACAADNPRFNRGAFLAACTAEQGN